MRDFRDFIEEWGPVLLALLICILMGLLAGPFLATHSPGGCP